MSTEEKAKNYKYECLECGELFLSDNPNIKVGQFCSWTCMFRHASPRGEFKETVDN